MLDQCGQQHVAGLEAHAANLGSHVRHPWWCDRVEAATDTVAHFAQGDLAAWVSHLQTPGHIDATDPTAHDDHVERLAVSRFGRTLRVAIGRSEPGRRPTNGWPNQ